MCGPGKRAEGTATSVLVLIPSPPLPSDAIFHLGPTLPSKLHWPRGNAQVHPPYLLLPYPEELMPCGGVFYLSLWYTLTWGSREQTQKSQRKSCVALGQKPFPLPPTSYQELSIVPCLPLPPVGQSSCAVLPKNPQSCTP